MGCAFGCLATFLTAGLFLPLWLLLDLGNLFTRYRCQTCGSKAPHSRGEIILACTLIAIPLGILLGVLVAAAYYAVLLSQPPPNGEPPRLPNF